jgi:hypothetical protein
MVPSIAVYSLCCSPVYDNFMTVGQWGLVLAASQLYKVPSCGGCFAGLRLQEQYLLFVSIVAELLESTWVAALNNESTEQNE